MKFQPFDKFRNGQETWFEGILSDPDNGKNDQFPAVIRQGDQQLFALKPAEYVNDGQTLSDVELYMHPEQEGVTLETLPEALREHLATALEVAVRRQDKDVDAELVKAVKEGRNLKAERETEAEYTRETRNVDHDLEAAYILRDSLKEEIHTALDEGRDADAKAAMEQLGAVKKDIAGYWNPHKTRPMVAQPLSENEELEVQLAEMETLDDLSRETIGEAISMYGKEAADALSRGDIAGHDEAIEKVRYYQGLSKASVDEEKAAFEQAEKDAAGTEYEVEGQAPGGHAARIQAEREQRVQGEGQGRG